jgi:hypothetical protein
MTHYADSSFLVSCYVLDTHSRLARDFLFQSSVSLPFNSLHALEVRSATNLGVFRSLFTRAEAIDAWRHLQIDLRAGRLRRVAVNWPAVFRRAGRLSSDYSASMGVRSLDILHVAAAKSLRARSFLSFDARQRTLADAVGLVVAP